MTMPSYSLTDRQGDVAVIRPRRVLMALGTLGAVLFVALGIWLLVAYPEDPRTWIAAPLAISFFGWAGLVSIKRIVNGFAMNIGPDGFTIAGPTFQPKLIPWNDVEQFGVFKVGRQGLVGARLRNYTNLVSQYTPAEVQAMLRRDRWLRGFTRVAVPIAPASAFSSTTGDDLEKSLRATQGADDLAGYFANRKTAYGYEITFGWPDRDRDAVSFANYLETSRQRYTQRDK